MIYVYIALIIIGALISIVLLHLLFVALLSLAVRKEEYDRPSGFYRCVMTYFYKIAMFLSNVKIKVKGREKLKETGGKYLLVENHRSDYDPFTTYLALRDKKLAFISKPENFKVPFFGKIARKCCYLAIDRENPRNAIKTINKASDYIKNGTVNMAIYPEGTRDYGKELLPFHDGVFKIAQKAGCAVVIAAVTGTEKVKGRAPLKKTVVTVEILSVIPAEDVLKESSHELSDRARGLIESATALK